MSKLILRKKAELAYEAHSPFRKTGVALPLLSSPSIFIVLEPIIQSTWIILLFPPFLMISSLERVSPFLKHFE